MFCEDCGVSMRWRCTDNITGLSKFKCPVCGKVELGVLDLKPPQPKPEPRHYYFTRGFYVVAKTTNYERMHIGTFRDEEMAKRVVEGMKACNWDKSMIPAVIEEAKLCTSA